MPRDRETSPTVTPPLVRDALPEFTRELRQMLRFEGRDDLIPQLDSLRLVDQCPCGEDSCATFYTAPSDPSRRGSDTLPLQPDAGMVNLDLLDGNIVGIEVLDRDDVKAALAAAL